MLPDEIVALIKQGEGYMLEFKQSVPSKASDLAEEICAFANSAGGKILIGVSDKGNVVGISLDNNNKSRLHNILNIIDPKINVEISEVSILDKIVLCIKCEAGKNKPYTVSGSIFIRNGPNTEKITSAQKMWEFFHQSDRLFFDEAICKKFKFPGDFDIDRFDQFLANTGIGNSLSQKIILENLALTRADQVKNATVLLFAKNPQNFYDHAVTRCLLFKGLEKLHILDDKIFAGNLISQYYGALGYLRQKLNLNYIIKGSGPRKEVLEIPEEVFKEALINALCHRDYYEKGAVTMVEIYDDRVEISNPGGLVNSISREDFGKKSFSRNPLIFNFFQRLNLVERVGSGINRMKDEMQKAGLPGPEFSLEGFFTAKFYRPIEFEEWIKKCKNHLSNAIVNVLQAIHEDPNITKPRLAEIIGQGKTSIDNHILQLKKLGILKRVGSRKAGKWLIQFSSLKETG